MPVFLLYAGILHAIGLALLLPMLITLPGPAGEPTPAPAPTREIAPIDVIVLPPPQALTDAGPEYTSALPSAPPAGVGTATRSGGTCQSRTLASGASERGDAVEGGDRGSAGTERGRARGQVSNRASDRGD